MVNKINLLSGRRLAIQKRKNKRHYVILTSLSLGGFFLIGLAFLVAYGLVLRFNYKNLEKKVAEKEKIITSLSDVEMKYTYLKDKSSSLVEILETSRKQRAIANYILTIFPEDIPLGGFAINSDWRVDLSGEANSFKSLHQTLENLLSQRSDDQGLIKLTGITLNSLSRGEEYAYQFKLLLSFE